MKTGESAGANPRSTLPPGLYLVATPIGNLEDITLRAVRVLKEADLIACEDTRRTQKLLNHYGISTRTVSYHEHNEMTRAPELVLDLECGARVALVVGDVVGSLAAFEIIVLPGVSVAAMTAFSVAITDASSRWMCAPRNVPLNS